VQSQRRQSGHKGRCLQLHTQQVSWTTVLNERDRCAKCQETCWVWSCRHRPLCPPTGAADLAHTPWVKPRVKVSPPPPCDHGSSSSAAGQLELGLYKRFFYLFVCVHESIISLSTPPICITHATAILLRDLCALYDLPPTIPLYAMHHILLVVTISCKG